VTVPTAFLVPFVLVWDGKKHEGFWEDMAFLVHWNMPLLGTHHLFSLVAQILVKYRDSMCCYSII
jgi:hypothetical protein